MKRYHFFSILIVSIVLAINFEMPAYAKETIVAFRYDDYSQTSPVDFERELFSAFKKRKLKLTVGVIPFQCAGLDDGVEDALVLSGEKAELLKEAVQEGVAEPALHGYCHAESKDRRDPESHATELFGLSYDQQLNRLSKGKEYLEKISGIPIRTFIPPWNSYDRETLRALESIGIQTISADRKRLSPGKLNLRYLPKTVYFNDLRRVVNRAQEIPEEVSIIVVLVHPFDFMEIGGKKGKFTFSEFEKTLDWLSSQADLKILTIDEIVTRFRNLDSFRYEIYKSYLKWFYFMPPLKILFFVYPQEVYLSPEVVYIAKAGFVFFLLLVLAGGFGFGCLVFRIVPVNMAAIIASWFFLIVFSLYSFKDFSLSYRGLIGIIVLIGFSCGISFFYFKVLAKTRRS